MDYQKIMCEFCKECKGIELNQKIQKTADKNCSNVLITKCINYCPKYHYDTESNRPKYIALF